MRLLTKTAAAAALIAGFGAFVASPAGAVSSGSTTVNGVVTTGPAGCLASTTCNASADGGGYNWRFTVPAFNPALGTLTSFSITLATAVTGDITLTNTAGTSATLGFAELSGTGIKAFEPNPTALSPFNPISTSLSTSVSLLGQLPIINLFDAGITSLTLSAGQSTCYQSDGVSPCANSLPALTGTATKTVNDSLAADLTAALSSWTVSGSVIGFQFSTSVSGLTVNAGTFGQEQLSVVYNYDLNCGIGQGLSGVPCATPEPASMTLLGAGLVGLGAIVRRRRKAA